MRPNLQQTINELKRELGVRRGVYPGWVANGKLTQQAADYRIACIEEAIGSLESIQEAFRASYTSSE